MATAPKSTTIEHYLGKDADALLGFSNPKIAKERLHLPGPDFVDRVFAQSNRSPRVLANLQRRAKSLGFVLQAIPGDANPAVS